MKPVIDLIVFRQNMRKFRTFRLQGMNGVHLFWELITKGMRGIGQGSAPLCAVAARRQGFSTRAT